MRRIVFVAVAALVFVGPARATLPSGKEFAASYSSAFNAAAALRKTPLRISGIYCEPAASHPKTRYRCGLVLSHFRAGRLVGPLECGVIEIDGYTYKLYLNAAVTCPAKKSGPAPA